MIRRMQPGDLPAALKLTQAEQWSHRLEDWQFHHRLGHGWVECSDAGALLATATWWAYGESFGAIGLVVVDRSQQGKGIGRRLMDTLIDDAGSRSLQLIATTAGLKLYRQCGFREAGVIEQRQGIVSPLLPLPPSADGTTVRAATAQDVESLVNLDTAAFGAPRRTIINQLLVEGSGLLAAVDGRPAGFAMTRQAGRGTLIGPLVADSEAVAIMLVARLLSAGTGFIRIDIPGDAPQLARWLDAAGLVAVDRVTSMLRGVWLKAQANVRTFGLVSQALG
jgi:ribosomal protein S18 acetylase RimI-like enzyme